LHASGALLNLREAQKPQNNRKIRIRQKKLALFCQYFLKC